MWKCANSGHEPFRQRITARSQQDQKCPACREAERLERNRHAATPQRAERRRLVRKAKRERLLPKVVLPPAPSGDDPRFSADEAAHQLGRSGNTVRRWINVGILKGERIGRGKGTFVVRQSEVNRVRALLDAGIDRTENLDAA